MTTGKARRPRPRFTGRAAILAVVVCAIVLSLAYPLREYLAQRHRIAELRSQIESAQQRIDVLERRKSKLEDPDYIRKLARQRLHYRMPGETNYVVVDRQEETGGGTRAPAGSSSPAQQRPWFANLWKSVQQANESGQS